MNKKISLDLLKIILTPREMKNVLGGSGDGDYCFICWIGGSKFKGTGVDASNCFDTAAALCDDSFVCAPITHEHCA